MLFYEHVAKYTLFFPEYNQTIPKNKHDTQKYEKKNFKQ